MALINKVTQHARCDNIPCDKLLMSCCFDQKKFIKWMIETHGWSLEKDKVYCDHCKNKGD